VIHSHSFLFPAGFAFVIADPKKGEGTDGAYPLPYQERVRHLPEHEFCKRIHWLGKTNCPPRESPDKLLEVPVGSIRACHVERNRDISSIHAFRDSSTPLGMTKGQPAFGRQALSA
jgi:hypothetical protein